MKELASALVKAQAEMTGAKKDSANPFFKSKYADLVNRLEEKKDMSADDEKALKSAIEAWRRPTVSWTAAAIGRPVTLA